MVPGFSWLTLLPWRIRFVIRNALDDLQEECYVLTTMAEPGGNKMKRRFRDKTRSWKLGFLVEFCWHTTQHIVATHIKSNKNWFIVHAYHNFDRTLHVCAFKMWSKTDILDMSPHSVIRCSTLFDSLLLSLYFSSLLPRMLQNNICMYICSMNWPWLFVS